ncbi:hypothetical protein CBE37_02640 [bacterium TMED277]|nr:MAG: hypothetical protein CBE37_02640 [bacterium TMED277]
MEFNYAGDLSPQNTWDEVKNDDNCFLVDCRSSAEWSLTGVPNLDSIGKKVVFVEWQIYPTMEKNSKFLQEISESGINKDSKIIFLCRSGARSRSAAEFLTSHGYKECYNCMEGFEGSHNEFGQRGKQNGWKFADLPWNQG